MEQNNPSDVGASKPVGRRGPWSKEDRIFIRQNYDKLTPEELAAELRRDADAVRKYLEQQGLITAYGVEESKYIDLRKSKHWPNLVTQFNEEELVTVVHHWDSMLEQFHENTTHTEEIQILDVIKVDILGNRLLTSEQQQKKTIDDLDAAIRAERRKPLEDRNTDYILNLEKQIANIYAAVETISREFRELLKQKNAMLDKLKATRDHRVESLEKKHESLISWIRLINEDPNYRKKLGLEMRKMSLGVKEEFIRLSEYHKYADGTVDQPILCAETLKEDHA
jgi:hypothetical protein